MHKEAKEAWTKAQDSSDNSNGSQEREKPWETASKTIVMFPPILGLFRDAGDFSDVSGNVCYRLSVTINLKATVWMVEFDTYAPFLS
jgi:hypothetical protein